MTTKFRVAQIQITPIPGSQNSSYTLQIASGIPPFNTLQEARDSLLNAKPNGVIFTIVEEFS